MKKVFYSKRLNKNVDCAVTDLMEVMKNNVAFLETVTLIIGGLKYINDIYHETKTDSFYVVIYVKRRIK